MKTSVVTGVCDTGNHANVLPCSIGCQEALSVRSGKIALFLIKRHCDGLAMVLSVY